jgi:hypothetical protein
MKESRIQQRLFFIHVKYLIEILSGQWDFLRVS